jgi:hypothetical protein
MRIGCEDIFLSIERRDLSDPDSYFRIEAASVGFGCRFSVVHDSVMFDASEDTLQALRDFEALRTKQIEILLTEEGWIRLERHARGNMTVRYRVRKSCFGSAMEGEIQIDGEFSGRICREFSALLGVDAERDFC